MELTADEVPQFMLPLCVLVNSSDRWHHLINHHHLSDLEMEQITTDLALYLKFMGDRLVGLSGAYVDDLLRAGTPELSKQQR